MLVFDFVWRFCVSGLGSCDLFCCFVFCLRRYLAFCFVVFCGCLEVWWLGFIICYLDLLFLCFCCLGFVVLRFILGLFLGY